MNFDILVPSLYFLLFVFLPGERRIGRAGLGLALAAADVVDDQDHGAEQRRHEIADEHRGAAGHVAADDAHDHADDAENDEKNTHELRSGHGENSFSGWISGTLTVRSTG